MRLATHTKKIIITIIALISLILVFNQPIKKAMIHSFHPQITATDLKNNEKAKAVYDYGQVKELTMSNIASARANAKDLKIVGVISVPSIGLTLPISKGITNRNLALSAGTFRPQMKMGQGNYALAGHNMSNLGPKVLFSPLYYKNCVGKHLYITNLKDVFEYRITQKEFISKYDTNVVANTPKQKIVTLITCDATGARRLMVRGKYIKKYKYKHAPLTVRKALSKKFNIK